MISRLRRILPICNFIISLSTITFQITVLKPWNDEVIKKIDILNLKLKNKLE
jgi:hypothetical protein